MRAEKLINYTNKKSHLKEEKPKILSSNHNSSKDINSTLTKTKDFSKEDNLLQNSYSGNLNDTKKFVDKNNSCKNFPYSKEDLINPNIKSNLNKNSIYSRNLHYKLRNIENILKYKDEAYFNDSYYNSQYTETEKISCNDYSNFNTINNNCIDLEKEKFKNNSTHIKKHKRNSRSSKFLNLYLGDFKSLSRENTNTILSQIDLKDVSVSLNNENEIRNIKRSNNIDLLFDETYDDSKTERKRDIIKDENKKYFLFEKKKKISKNDLFETSINDITPKFNYYRNSNYLNFNINRKNFEKSNTKLFPRKIRKNKKNFERTNNKAYNRIDDENNYKISLTEEYQSEIIREDNTVMNLFNYLNINEDEINKNYANINNNLSFIESENYLINNNNLINLGSDKFENISDQEDFININYANHSAKWKDDNEITRKIFATKSKGIIKKATTNFENKCFPNKKNIEFKYENTFYSKKIYCNKQFDKDNEEKKLSNISVLSIKSENSSNEDSRFYRKFNSVEENSLKINKINKSDLENSNLNLSNYASNIDEVILKLKFNIINFYSLKILIRAKDYICII